MLRGLALVAGIVLLAACAPVRIKADAGLLAAQTQREAVLSGRDHWTLTARLGVSNGRDGGSGSLTWVQDGDRYDFTVRAPVTGRSFRLHGGPDGAVLDGLDKGRVRGVDAQSLLARELGWQVPLAQLRAWVRGVRAAGSAARLSFGATGLPALLQQDGWSVEYRAGYADRSPPLPRKVFAERAPYRVRVSIESWTLQ
jgi:outer membrane lipoprotein LolB